MSLRLKKILMIAGPTSAGKSRLGFLIAQKIGGEIISCDAMQVYKEISIASNKPSLEILRKIPHHLINIVSVKDEFNAAIFRKKARGLIKKIHSKNKIPVIVGGTGLYMAVLLDGIFKDPGQDAVLRRRLEKIAKQKGRAFLHRELQKKDPAAAKKIHPNDERRIIRALEVFKITGRPISELQKNREGIWGKFDIKIFAVMPERQALYERINARVDDMFTEGLVDEIRRLKTRKLGKTAQSIIGIKEVQGFLDGQYDLERCRYLMKLKTRHYAKRQLSWFRREKRLKWIILKENATLRKTAQRIAREMSHG